MATIQISLEEYQELLEALTELEALKQEGVESWTGYEGAMDLIEEWEFDGEGDDPCDYEEVYDDPNEYDASDEEEIDE